MDKKVSLLRKLESKAKISRFPILLKVEIENSIAPLPDYFVQAGFRAGG